MLFKLLVIALLFSSMAVFARMGWDWSRVWSVVRVWRFYKDGVTVGLIWDIGRGIVNGIVGKIGGIIEFDATGIYCIGLTWVSSNGWSVCRCWIPNWPVDACGAVEEEWLLFSSSVDSWQWVLLKAADTTEVPADFSALRITDLEIGGSLNQFIECFNNTHALRMYILV